MVLFKDKALTTSSIHVTTHGSSPVFTTYFMCPVLKFIFQNGTLSACTRSCNHPPPDCSPTLGTVLRGLSLAACFTSSVLCGSSSPFTCLEIITVLFQEKGDACSKVAVRNVLKTEE